jgi:hypothetical protein
MNNFKTITHYTFALILILLTGWLVFFENHSGWWFLLTWLLIEEMNEN